MLTLTDVDVRLDPLTEGLKERNALADRLFYDVGDLTGPEQAWLLEQTNLEGAILVVEPRAGAEAIRIEKFESFERFRAEPGDLLRHFAVAGVGSTDLGAAALARSLANHLDAPVGAIVAGYGLADLALEAIGGWLFFGTINRWLGAWRLAEETFTPSAIPGRTAVDRFGAETTAVRPGTDTDTLVRVLSEPERRVETLLGHSKGCLSLSYALRTVALQVDQDHLRRARDIDVITTGAVVVFPRGLERLRQYLGVLDWFGGMNSCLSVPYVPVPDAWHHLNTGLPAHMDLDAALDGAYD